MYVLPYITWEVLTSDGCSFLDMTNDKGRLGRERDPYIGSAQGPGRFRSMRPPNRPIPGRGLPPTAHASLPPPPLPPPAHGRPRRANAGPDPYNPRMRMGPPPGGGFLDSRPRVFVALFDYDPESMSPNPDGCEEELPFQEGELIRVLEENY